MAAYVRGRTMSETIRVGVIGAGAWGPNLIRCFRDAAATELAVVCDVDPDRRRLIELHHPGVSTCEDAERLFADPSLDAIVVATATESHHRLAHAALSAGKHVLVEKPICGDSQSAEELVRLAADRRLILMTGHIFLYNGAVREVKNIIAREAFGDLRYMYARRTNLGPVRRDVHAGWDLASHDISIFLFLKGAVPQEVTASSQTFIRPGIADLVFATLYFEDGTVAHLHTSWLDPQKVRQVVVVGGSQMLVFDDMNLMEPVRIYNKGWRKAAGQGDDDQLVDTFGAFRVELLQGDVVIPPLSTGEPLRREVEAFIRAIESGTPPVSDGRLGVDVVRVLEAMDRSIADNSRRVRV